MTDSTKALVYMADGISVPVTDSRKVANFYGKAHRHVLDAIRDAISTIPDDFFTTNSPTSASVSNEPKNRLVNPFIESMYVDEKGETVPLGFHSEIQRDGSRIAPT